MFCVLMYRFLKLLVYICVQMEDLSSSGILKGMT